MNARHATNGGGLVWAVLILLLAASARAQTTWYVDDDAPNDPGPGDPTISDPAENGSAEHPFDAIQEGIDVATDSDTVLVLDGTYTGTGNRGMLFGGKLITVRSENGPENCIIDCQRAGRGFYFHNEESPDSRLEGVTICGGYRTYGGAILCHTASPTIVNCRLIDNIAFGQGGQAGGVGGGIDLFASCPTIVGCVIAGNSTYYGYGMGGGITCDGDSDAIILDCVIAGNSARKGAGMYCMDGSTPIVANCRITNNTATDKGSALYCNYSGLTLTNCTISANSSDEGGAVHCHYCTPRLFNCILWGNTPVPISTFHGAVELAYCDIEDGWEGEGNIDADPLFVDPDGPDDDPNTWEDNDFHLGAGSPCIDTGDPEFVQEPDDRDIDGQWRVWDGGDDGEWRIDMGSDEFGSHYPGDLDGDDDVDLTDLAQLLANYGAIDVTPADGDFDLDGDVDLSDLSALLAAYGTTCP